MAGKTIVKVVMIITKIMLVTLPDITNIIFVFITTIFTIILPASHYYYLSWNHLKPQSTSFVFSARSEHPLFDVYKSGRKAF